MTNEVWETIFKDTNQDSDICKICGMDKKQSPKNEAGEIICEAAEEHCPESK
tara:strand:- start:2318 stop:2473 length:156 start_codon:yes stop_codon:yes gene_type:complete